MRHILVRRAIFAGGAPIRIGATVLGAASEKLPTQAADNEQRQNHDRSDYRRACFLLHQITSLHVLLLPAIYHISAGSANQDAQERVSKCIQSANSAEKEWRRNIHRFKFEFLLSLRKI
jgi:hypothetical protein